MIDHDGTPGCRACDDYDTTKVHSKECRERFQGILEKAGALPTARMVEEVPAQGVGTPEHAQPAQAWQQVLDAESGGPPVPETELEGITRSLEPSFAVQEADLPTGDDQADSMFDILFGAKQGEALDRPALPSSRA